MSEPTLPEQTVAPPTYVSGGKRLNFSRYEPWGDGLTETFLGSGKDEGCYPSGSWAEMCALAELIVKHPAFIPDARAGETYCPPVIENEVDRV